MEAEQPRAISRDRVARLLNPRSVAVVGVSERVGTAGRNVLANLVSHEYRGDLHLVTRSGAEIDGRKSVASIDDLPEGIDLAVLTVPGAAIPETVEALARRKVASIMCFASGFAEVGDAGLAAQEKVAALCRAEDIAFAGPNCLGYLNMVDDVVITFGVARRLERLPDLKIGILVQSGAMAGVFRTAAAAECLGFTYSVSTGNEAVLGVEDYLPFLIENDETRVIVTMVEAIRRPRDFMRQAAAARARNKPIVVLHLGTSDRAKESAKSHTGALAGDYAVMEAFVRSEDVILVETLDEMIDTANVLAHYPLPKPGGIGVVTDSGAFKGFSLDYCERIGLPVTAIQPETRARLKEIVPDFVPADNPVDVTAQAIFDFGMYTRSLEALLDDPGVGCALASIMAGTPEMGMEKADYVIAGKGSSPKPVLCAFMGGDQVLDPGLKLKLTGNGVPFFRSPEQALRALGRAMQWGRALETNRLPASPVEVAPVAIKGFGPVPEYQGKGFLKAAGIPVPDGALARDAAEAARIAKRIGYPVVLKAQAAELTHKSDIGGVAVGIADDRALRAAFEKMAADIATAHPALALDGILVEAMGGRGVEMVVGARRDPGWGPTLMIGLGGVWTEALGDVRFLPADAHPDLIAEEAGRLRGAKLLQGFRGAPPADIEAFADAASRIGALMIATPSLTDIDVNPLVVYPQGEGVLALDALLIAEE